MTIDQMIAELEKLKIRFGGSTPVACWPDAGYQIRDFMIDRPKALEYYEDAQVVVGFKTGITTERRTFVLFEAK